MLFLDMLKISKKQKKSFKERGGKKIVKEKMDPSFGIFGNIILLKMEFSELNNYLPETQPDEPAVQLGYWKV
jgi:hypothetical protein